MQSSRIKEQREREQKLVEREKRLQEQRERQARQRQAQRQIEWERREREKGNMRKHQRVYEVENRVKVGVMSEVARNYREYDADTKRDLARIGWERCVDVSDEIRNIEIREEMIRQTATKGVEMTAEEEEVKGEKKEEERKDEVGNIYEEYIEKKFEGYRDTQEYLGKDELQKEESKILELYVPAEDKLMGL